MKTTSIIAISAVIAALSAPVFAEPASFKQLSVHAGSSASAGANTVSVGRTAGMDKYGPYHGRHTNLSADTEIAVFEEADDSAQGYSRAVRSDRIPSR